ncbi:MAG: glycosyltransferase family 2 protein [Kiloniellales bacterium]
MKISVTMPAYNAERFLAEAIESILGQTFADFELIVVNDGSTDDTLSIAESYAWRDHRVRVVTQPHGGISSGRNRGLAEARGEWIAVMDADDVSLPQRLERQFAFVEANPDIALACAYAYNIDDSGKIIAQFRSPLTDRAVVRDRIERNEAIGFHHSAVLMRRDVVQSIGGYREQFDGIEDCDLWNRFAETGHGVLVQPEYLVKYRLHGKSHTISRVRQLTLRRQWLNDCMRHRRRDAAEPSWESFLARRGALPWTTRLQQERTDLSWILYRQAVSAYLRGSHHSMLTNLSGALLLSPRRISRRVWHRYLEPRLTGRLIEPEGDANGPRLLPSASDAPR